MRNVIVHYHIFKNAGTSIDKCLEQSFGFLWSTFDQDDERATITSGELYQFLMDHPHLRAVSSHQARWPEPSLGEVRAHPIVFVRHPVDRIGSMYAFAVRRSEALAEGATLSQYVDRLLAPEQGFVARSAQTLFLSDDDQLSASPEPATEVTADHLEQALSRLTSLPVFGLVERFTTSLALFARHLCPLFFELRLVSWHENASSDRPSTLEQRVQQVRDALGARRYTRLLQANEADMELWSHAMMLFEGRSTRILQGAQAIDEA